MGMMELLEDNRGNAGEQRGFEEGFKPWCKLFTLPARSCHLLGQCLGNHYLIPLTFV